MGSAATSASPEESVSSSAEVVPALLRQLAHPPDVLSGAEGPALDAVHLPAGACVGPYKIVARLGSGGMGVVHEAQDMRLGRRVALKFVSADLANDADARSRFRREARAASALNHPHICTIHDVGEHEGVPYLVMELLEGETLLDRLARGPLPPAEFFDVALAVASALGAAGDRGIVHRDLKPANVFLTRSGGAKVLDFGLARIGEAGDTPTQTSTRVEPTRTGAVMGTLHYMSPEQVRGEPLDARTDLFSFGVVLYEMVAGRRPFAAGTAGLVADAILNRQAVPPDVGAFGFPPGLARVIGRALEKDLGLRYQTAADLGADLQRLRVASGFRPAEVTASALPVPPRGLVGRVAEPAAVKEALSIERDGEGTWRRLTRRKVVQWGLAYSAGAFGLLQGIGFAADAFAWPGDIKRVALLLLLIGLPIVLTLAWYHGDRGAQRVTRIELAIITLILVLSGGIFWRYETATAPPSAPAPLSAARTVDAALSTALSSTPSLAVLPFDNMSGDPRQDHLGPGVAEDIITVLSTLPTIRVVSRTSSFIYDKPVKVQQVAQDLGVSYVLQGSVKKSADKVRITAQLINATTGDHVWANGFDREGEVLTLQEEVANAIYDSLAGFTGAIRKDEERRAWSKAKIDLEEYDYYLRGHRHFFGQTGEDIARARQIWREGLTKFPDSALLRIKIAFTYCEDVYYERSTDPLRDLGESRRLLEQATAVESKSQLETWLFHWLSADMFRLEGDFDRAAREAEAAVALVPYDALSHIVLADTMTAAGRPDRAIEWAEIALKRAPNAEDWWHQVLAFAYYNAGRPEEALAKLERRKGPCGDWRCWAASAAIYARLGKMDEARQIIAAFRAKQPDYTVQKEAVWPTWKNPQMKEPYLAAYLADLIKAGLPEK
jgi:TolB-like protein